MARLIERFFQPDKPLVARRFFVAGGRHFNPGDEFPWRRMAIAQRRVKLLFDGHKIMHPADVDTSTPAAPEAASAPVIEPVTPSRPEPEPLVEVGGVGAVLEPTVPSVVQEMQDEDIHHIAVTATPADDTPAEDDLDGLNMRELRAIAEVEGAPTRLRRDDQREAIREHRRAQQ